MQIRTAVITAPRRLSYLRATLHSLTEAGFEDIELFADAPDSCELDFEDRLQEAELLPSVVRVHRTERRLGPYRNTRRAIRGLLDSGESDALAVFQDDIVVSRGLRAWLDAHLWPADDCGAVSLYTALPMHPEPLPETPTWQRFAGKPVKSYGACCNLFRPDRAAEFLAANVAPESLNKVEQHIARWACEAGYSLWHVSPSLVEHVGEISTLHNFGVNDARRAGKFLEAVG